MPVRIVQSKQNARLKELRRALANPGRELGREGGGLAGIEGPILLEEALRAGLRIVCVFATEGAEPLLEAMGLPAEVEILVMAKELLDSALTTEAPQAIAALVEPPDWTWAHIVGVHRPGETEKKPALVIVLDSLQDPGNLGTILRSAEAFGADGVICLPGTVNAWNPKAVRASVGSIFRLPVLAVSAQDCFARLAEAGAKIWTTTVNAAQPANLVDLAGPVALLIGNEGKGVSDHLSAQAAGGITIPCPGPVESLNAAVAASVLLYEASRQRLDRSGVPPQHLGGLR